MLSPRRPEGALHRGAAVPRDTQSNASLDALATAAAAAAGERASTRVLVLDTFVKSVDAARDALYADLVKVGQKKKRGRDWPDRLFRTLSRERAVKVEEAAPVEEGKAGGDK